MKTALVTTTINVPYVLAHYRAIAGKEVPFFVTGDQKTPDAEVQEFCAGVKGVHYFSAAEQEQMGYACSEFIGWNTIGRRCIAILEAVKWGAEHIITIDDDNLPLDATYFLQHTWPFVRDFCGLQVQEVDWFDVGQHLIPKAKHRGFPHGHAEKPVFAVTSTAKVGVAAGLCLGDPDIDATTRLEHAPEVQGFSEPLRRGITVAPGVRTVFNTQNTSFLRQFAPCFLLPPQWGRFDDILASLVCQRVMQETGHCVHFGMPAVWQQRNAHSTLRDLSKEIEGMQGIRNFYCSLEMLSLPTGNAINKVRYIYETLVHPDPSVNELASAWCDDMEKVL